MTVMTIISCNLTDEYINGKRDEWWIIDDLIYSLFPLLVNVTSNGELKLPMVNSVEFSTNLLGTISWLQGSNGDNTTVSTSKYVLLKIY